MTSPPAHDDGRPGGLAALAAEVRRDFERMLFPAPNWVPPVAGPDGRPALDVLVIGGGMCGQTAAFALVRDGVRNIRVIDRSARGREGPWGTYARMDTLRSPKHLTGPDLGFPALTFRAWYEAQHGADGWQRLYKIATSDWLAYLLWVRDTVPIADRERRRGDADRSRPRLRSRAIGRTWRRRDRLCAQSRAGGRTRRRGRALRAAVPLAGARPAGRASRVFHSSDSIDFARFKGGRVGVLGASASAFDNAAVALEAGAAQVSLFSRRPRLPQVNKSKWTVFPGFFHGYADLDDARALADLHLHLRRGRAAAARVGAALRPSRRLRHPLRRALDRRDPRGRRRHRGDAQGALQLRRRHPRYGLRRRPGPATRARAPARQDRAVGRSHLAAGSIAPSRGRPLPLSGTRLRARRAHAGHGAGPRAHPLLQCRLDHEPRGRGRRHPRPRLRRQPPLPRHRPQPVRRQRRDAASEPSTPTTTASWSPRATSCRGESRFASGASPRTSCRRRALRRDTRQTTRLFVTKTGSSRGVPSSGS